MQIKITDKPRMWVYHYNTPEGLIVWEEDGLKMLSKGWVRNPNDIKKPKPGDKNAGSDSKNQSETSTPVEPLDDMNSVSHGTLDEGGAMRVEINKGKKGF